MSKKEDVPQFYKERIARHLRAYMDRHGIRQPAEIERLLDVHSGTGTRLLKAERVGLGTFIRIAKLLGDAHHVLFFEPEGPHDKRRNGSKPSPEKA